MVSLEFKISASWAQSSIRLRAHEEIPPSLHLPLEMPQYLIHPVIPYAIPMPPGVRGAWVIHQATEWKLKSQNHRERETEELGET